MKGLIRSTNNNLCYCDVKYIKTKFSSEHDLSLKKNTNVDLIIVVGLAVNDGSKYYPQVLLYDWLYKLELVSSKA